VLGLGDVIGIVVGSVIGSGIFIVPATIALQVRAPVLIMTLWLVGGALSLAGAFCFAELGGMFPHAGGIYVYLREAYGPPVAFLFGWTLFLVIDTGAMATLASAFATKYLPHFVELAPAGTRLVSVAFIVFLAMINILGVRYGANLQNALTVVKIGSIIAVSVLVFSFGQGDAANFVNPPAGPPTLELFAGFSAALIACMWAYKGWEAATFSAGELRDPRRHLAIGLVVGNLIIATLYLVANLAYLWVVPAGEMAGSPRIAAEALARAVGPGSASALSLLILLSILGAANSNVLTTPRVLFAMAEDGLFFPKLRHVHPRFHTPDLAILLLGGWAAVLAVSGTFEQLLAFVVFGQWIFFGLTAGAVLVLRRRRPQLARPVVTWGYPATPVLFIAAAAFIAVSAAVANPWNAAAGLGLIGLGLPAYALWRPRRAPPERDAS
jgi:APA family basic amino acid/polyamine antiporter